MTIPSPIDALKLSMIACLLVASFAAGSAMGADAYTVSRLQQSVDFLVKARALIDAAAPEKGAQDAKRARNRIDRAIEDVQRTLKANGA